MFAAHGASLVLLDQLSDELQATAAEFGAEGHKVETVVGDITDEDTAERLLEAADAFGPPSIVVNAAGVIHRTPITELTLQDLEWMWRINASGTVAITQCLLPGMIEHGYGKVINVGSLGSIRGLECRTAYAASKGAVAQYTVSLASEIGAHGIRVNAVAPGYVATDMASSWMFDDPDRMQSLLGRIPLGRFAEPADLAGAFLFLAAPASDYMTGQVLLVDGGWTTT